MRRSFIYSVLYLPTLASFTSATPPACNKAQSKIRLTFDLNELPTQEIPPKSCSSSDEQIASSPAMDNLMHPSRYTPEELAANIPVFTGLRGPNHFADVHSASSHGRDHRGYPLGQQSSSYRFSSTSPGKRKTSDSSAGSTSKRYKKGDTSDRHEPYNVINQHFSLQNPVSDLIPTSSKPESVLPTEKNPTRDAIRNLKEKESTVCTGLSTNSKEVKLLNVNDWEFLREYPEREKDKDHQHRYLRYLNKCKGASDLESVFFIQRDRANKFLTQYVSGKLSQVEFNVPTGTNTGLRLGMIFKTLLRLSDKKIYLERYPFFEERIIGGMRKRFTNNFKTTQNPSKTRMETLMRFVRDVTKVTQILIVVQLSLFKEHEKELLTVEEIEKHLRILEELWFEIDDGTPEMQKKDWAMKARVLFKFQAHEKHFQIWLSKKHKNYHFCWNLVNYWREKTGRSLMGLNGQEVFPKILQELVNKIIFFSNYQAEPSSFQNKIPRNQRRQRKLSARGKN